MLLSSLQWRHNEHNGVSNHRDLDCLLVIVTIHVPLPAIYLTDLNPIYLLVVRQISVKSIALSLCGIQVLNIFNLSMIPWGN